MSLNMVILNGCKPGDIFGKYTSFHWNGKEVVVDYGIVPADIFENIENIGHFIYVFIHKKLSMVLSATKTSKFKICQNFHDKKYINQSWRLKKCSAFLRIPRAIMKWTNPF